MGKGRKRQRWKQDRRGFTLVEIIVVLVILAILAAFTIPAMLGFVEDARGKAYIAEAREIYTAMQSALTEVGAQQTNQVVGNDYYYGLIKYDSTYIIAFKPDTNDVESTETEQKIGQKALELIGNDIKFAYTSKERASHFAKITISHETLKVTSVVYHINGYTINLTSGDMTTVTKDQY